MRQLRLVAISIALTLAGCTPLPSGVTDGGKPSPSAAPGIPGVSGTVTYLGAEPGVRLTVALHRLGESSAHAVATASTDVHGDYRFDGLEAGAYQVRYDDNGNLAKSVLYLVTDPATASSDARINVDVGWDVNTQVTATSQIAASWSANPSLPDAMYQAQVSRLAENLYLTSIAAPPSQRREATIALTYVPSGTNYLEVVAWHTGQQIDGRSYYAVSKPIAFTAP